MSIVRIGRFRSAVMAGLAFTLALGSAAAAPAQANPQVSATQLVGFVVGGDGRLYASSGGTPTRVSDSVVAPPGAGVSAVRQPDGTVAAFTIGNDGGLVAASSRLSGSGLYLFRDGPSGLAPPGTPVSATSGPYGIQVFFVGVSGAVFSVSYSSRVQPGGLVRAMTGGGLAPQRAVVAAVPSATSPAGVVFVGANGGVYSVWQSASGGTSVGMVSPSGLVAPGAGIAATGLGRQAFVSGHDGRLWRVYAGPQPVPWQPQAISAAAAAPSGARLTVTEASTSTLHLFFGGANGAIHALTYLNGAWTAPIPTTPAGVVMPGGPVAGVALGDYLWVGWCGNDRWWWWRWPWPRPWPWPYPWPPPPPDPFGDLLSFPAQVMLRGHYEIAVTVYM